MQILFEFLPIALFFAAYKFGDLFIATGVLIVAVVIQAIVQWIRHRKISPMMLTSAILVLVFGGMTLILQDTTFIMWKPTILYGLFAIAFTISRFFGVKTLIERLMGENIQLERSVWQRLNWLWVVFFIGLGALNLYVAYNFDEPTWVNFKLFGLLGLTLVFGILQSIWLTNKIPNDTAAEAKATAQEEKIP
ncbi:MAG: septation protein A [Candidatus Obscuribacterales bacterium]|nr:septation protein A [Steroidobacteraceae bacterium]